MTSLKRNNQNIVHGPDDGKSPAWGQRILNGAWRAAVLLPKATVLVGVIALHAADLLVPNDSFESPVVPAVTPYAGPEVDIWEKTAQPAWYDPSKNSDTPWSYLMGTFYNVPFPGQTIDNCHGRQAAFLFALPEAGLFQDYDSTPSHALNAVFKPGNLYTLTVAVIGGGGGMKSGATLQLALYYRDGASNKVTVAATTITNSTDAFPTSTHFVDYHVEVPATELTDPWAGKHIGIQLLSTTAFELAGGYWDLDHVRLTQTQLPRISAVQANTNLLSFTLESEPGLIFQILSTTNLANPFDSWPVLNTVTNVTGEVTFSDSIAGPGQRFYRARQL